jgi:cytidine deaminase
MTEAARRVSEHAYCRYSRFPVGATVLTASGEIFAGCNVENASFSLTICAERNAIFQAVAHGHRSIQAIVVFTRTEYPTPPCGACRQVINEFGPQADVFVVAKNNAVLPISLDKLLPNAFGPHNLTDFGLRQEATDGGAA